jgi:hypothetical protein
MLHGLDNILTYTALALDSTVYAHCPTNREDAPWPGHVLHVLYGCIQHWLYRFYDLNDKTFLQLIDFFSFFKYLA